MVDFGKCLKKAQEQKSVNCTQLAKMLGVHRQQVNIWRNKKNCRLDTLIKVCEALDFTVDEFLQR